MGSANIIAQQFGGATTSTDMMEGIMGVGWGYGTDTSYYNVIDQLANQGITHSRTFSLDLASIDVAQGKSPPYFESLAKLSRFHHFRWHRHNEVHRSSRETTNYSIQSSS